MELSTSRKTPKRQDTLGPTSPIQDWEVERATILVETKRAHEKAERLEKELETDRQTYEKNTLSLLREVKLKDTFTEKKLKDVEEQLMKEILGLQRKLDDEKTSRQEEIQTIRSEHDSILEQEDKKYQRRLKGLQERLNAKDTEYAELFENEKNENNDEEKEKMIESLNLEIAKERSENAQLRELNSSSTVTTSDATNDDAQNLSNEFEELQAFCKTIQEKLKESELRLKKYGQKQKEYIEKVQELENHLAAAKKQSQVHKKRLDQIVSGHDAHIKGLTEKFMSEAQRSQMTNQAQFQNLQSEHTEMVRELREQYETEKEVWGIEQKALMDKIRRDANFEKEEVLRELTREFNDKNEDLHASMSKDAMEIQKHWESKLEEAKSKSILQVSRLHGEMEVIKDRLGREIHRRKQNQTVLAEALEKNKSLNVKSQKYQKKCSELLKQRTMIEKEIAQLKTMYHTSCRLALDLLAITSSTVTIDSNYTNLPDILQTAIRYVSIMRINGEASQDYQDSSFDIDTIPTYGF